MRKTFFSFLLISILLFLADYYGVLDSLKSPFEPGISKFKKILYQGLVDLKYFPAVLFSYRGIIKNIDNSRITAVDNDKMKLKIIQQNEEIESLRRQLNAPLPASIRLIPANVIAVSRYMEIDAGFNNGVKGGMGIVEGSVLIGKISKSTEFRSQIWLLTDNDLTIPAITSRGTRGRITGQMGKYILFSQVLQKDPLFLDDILLTSGEEGFPANLMIGKIIQIEGDDAVVYKSAQVSPYAEFNKIKKVYVVEAR